MDPALDIDTRAVMSLLRGAVDSSGLTQSAFARAVGTSGSRLSTYLAGSTRPSAHFCLRAQRLSQSLSRAASVGLASAPATAEAMGAHLRSGDQAWAWRSLLQGRDHLRVMLAGQDEELLGSWEAAPGVTGSAGFDALLAALARHEFDGADRGAPGWSRVEPLTQPWVPEHPFLGRERVIATTPAWLGELNIFVPARDLVTA